MIFVRQITLGEFPEPEKVTISELAAVRPFLKEEWLISELPRSCLDKAGVITANCRH